MNRRLTLLVLLNAEVADIAFLHLLNAEFPPKLAALHLGLDGVNWPLAFATWRR